MPKDTTSFLLPVSVSVCVSVCKENYLCVNVFCVFHMYILNCVCVCLSVSHVHDSEMQGQRDPAETHRQNPSCYSVPTWTTLPAECAVQSCQMYFVLTVMCSSKEKISRSTFTDNTSIKLSETSLQIPIWMLYALIPEEV